MQQLTFEEVAIAASVVLPFWGVVFSVISSASGMMRLISGDLSSGLLVWR